MKTQLYLQFVLLFGLLWGGGAVASESGRGNISVNRSSMRPLTERERQKAPVVVEYRTPRSVHIHPEGRKHPLILVPAPDGYGYIVVGPVRRTAPDTRSAPNLRPAQIPPRNDEAFENTAPPLRAAQIAPRN